MSINERAGVSISLSVVVPVRLPHDMALLVEAIAFWRDCIAAQPQLEVLLITNGPTQGHLKDLVNINKDSRVRYIDASALSTCKADNLNIGVRHSLGDVIAFFDVDSRPEQRSLIAGYECAKEEGGRIVQGPKLVLTASQSAWYKQTAFCIVRLEYLLRFLAFGGVFRERVGSNAYFAGSNGFFPRQVLLSTPFRQIAFAEDMDISARLYYSNDPVRYNPQVITLESPPANLIALARQHFKLVVGWMVTVKRYGTLMVLRRRTSGWSRIVMWPIWLYLAVTTALIITTNAVGVLFGPVLTYGLLILATFAAAQLATRRVRKQGLSSGRSYLMLNIFGSIVLPLELAFLLIAFILALVGLGNPVYVTDKAKPVSRV
jgi:cellulose synthase/poly-beta-1,6-N-acetylglucosamine synthase-like glycosyltransferase